MVKQWEQDTKQSRGDLLKLLKSSVENNCSDKVLMRMPKHLHVELTRVAKVQGVSLNQYLLYLISHRNAE